MDSELVFAARFRGVFCHLVRGEGIYACARVHMWLLPLAEGLPKQKKKVESDASVPFMKVWRSNSIGELPKILL